MIRVLLAEDEAMFRSAVRRLLDWEPDVDVVGEVGSGDELLTAVERHHPEVAVVDIEMPGMNGLEAAARLRQQAPGCRVLIVTTFGRPGFLQRALESGVYGFVLKDASIDALAASIRRCAAGERVIDPGVAAAARRVGVSPLTGGERAVLAAMATGASVREISHALHLAQGTIRNRISSAIEKVYARNRLDAIRIVRENGWL
ncbi:MAG: response regulator transcription factor [Candidatus Dormibacteraeota bacterium]|nr:response regulator transcription factor [Candidatus Dormibacteraeota bacterium]